MAANRKSRNGGSTALSRASSSALDMEWSRGLDAGFLSPLSGFGTSWLSWQKLNAAITMVSAVRSVAGDCHPEWVSTQLRMWDFFNWATGSAPQNLHRSFR